MTEVVERQLKRIGVTVSKPILAAICIIFGLLIIFVPALLSILVGIFLIIQGVLLLLDYYELTRQQSPSRTPPTSA